MNRKKKAVGKFPQEVARFFNPFKSGSNAEFDKNGKLIKLGINQQRRLDESKTHKTVYNAGGTARICYLKGVKTYI